jgi:hypothetical protein
MLKLKKFLHIGIAAFGLSQMAFAEAEDMGLSLHPGSAYVLQRGVLQLDAYASYSNESMGKAIGADTQAAGTFEEIGSRIWFGLSDKTTASFFFGRSEFNYNTNNNNKMAEIGFQEFRLKRGILTGQSSLGFMSVEAGWSRHSTYNFDPGNGVIQNKSNTLYDYGYNLKLSSTKPLSESWDFHSHFGYSKTLVDGDGGQNSWESGLGVSKFWRNLYRFDIYTTFRKIKRDSPVRSSGSDSNNSLHLAVTRHISDQWSWDMRAQYNDNLFRGIWPFLDQEMSNVSVSDYGFISMGFSYRTKY